MKQLLYSSTCITALMLYACTAQSYTFTVKNFTPDQHTVAVQLKGTQKPSDPKTVQSHPIHAGDWGQLFNQAWQTVSDIRQMTADKLSQLSMNLDNIDENTLLNKLTDLKKEIEHEIKAQALKASAKKWVQNLHQLTMDIAETFLPNFDKKELAKRLTKLQAEVTDMLQPTTEALEQYTAVFSFGGLKSGLCVSKILIDGKDLPIYGLTSKQYDNLQRLLREKNYDAFQFTIGDDKSKSHYTNMSKSLVGVCFSRQFDIVQLKNGELIIITKEKL